MWTKSACVVLAWSILLILLVAGGMKGSVPAQANIRIASSTSSTSSTKVTLASTLSVAAAFVPAARPAARYVVQPGDTLSGIAARFAVRGGWPALYAANRPLLGPDPDVIRPGTVLVLPGQAAPVRYTVVAGDTLAGIAAALAVRGGWPALYVANRRVIGPDPGVIRPGTVLRVPRAAAPSPAAVSPGRRTSPPPSAPAGSRSRPAPVRASAPATAGMPRWLKTVLLAAGLLVGVAFLAEPVLLLRRRRQAAARADRPGMAGPGMAGSGQEPGCEGRGPVAGELAPEKARVVLADYDRVVVTHSACDGMVYVLRPPGEDPKAILRAARLVLPEDLYQELARQLGLPVSWPIVLADYDRLVVTHSACDGMVYVLRPPGEDPKAILRAARLVLPEGPYEELADQLGIPAGWAAG
jgi:LysM repeat protein